MAEVAAGPAPDRTSRSAKRKVRRYQRRAPAAPSSCLPPKTAPALPSPPARDHVYWKKHSGRRNEFTLRAINLEITTDTVITHPMRAALFSKARFPLQPAPAPVRLLRALRAPRSAFVRWLVFLQLGLALAHPLALRADTFGNFTYSVADGAVTITRYTGSDTSLVIPDQIANLPVTSIEGFAFSANSSLIFITLPSSVSMVGERAFASCPALTSISVDPANPHFASADGVLFDKTFQTLIQAPGGLVGAYSPPAELTTIGNSAFRDCKKLTDITLPDGLASIGNEAFYGCSGLTDTTLPESLGSMGKFAFYGCIKLSSTPCPPPSP